MKKIKILVFGKNSNILKTVIRLINQNDNWRGEGTEDEELVIEKLQAKSVDLLMIGGGVSPQSEKKLRALAAKLEPNPKIIQHFGGGSGLLTNEITAALADDKSPTFKIMDDPFS